MCSATEGSSNEMQVGSGRIPNFRIKEGAQIEYWPGAVIGPKLVPLTWDVAENVAR